MERSAFHRRDRAGPGSLNFKPLLGRKTLVTRQEYLETLALDQCQQCAIL